MNKAQIETIQDEIESVLSSVLDHTNISALMERLTLISTYLGTCARAIAESKRLELTKRGAYLRQHEERISKMKPSVAKEFVSTSCIDEQILWLRCDRNYSALAKAGENLRTVLSTMKAEMQFAGS
jgi:hypothetical protein